LNIDLKLLKRHGGPTILYNLIIYSVGQFEEDEIEVPPPDFLVQVYNALGTIPKRGRQVLIWRYLENETRSLAQVGKLLYVTRERVRQIEHKALRKLRHGSRHRFFGIRQVKKSRCRSVRRHPYHLRYV